LGKIACRMLENYILSIRQEIPKGKHRGDDTGFVFLNQRGNKLHHDTLWNIVTHYAKEAGMGKKVTPHVFRHTFATQLVKNGADITAVQKMLGHSHLSVTQLYTRVAGVEVKKTHQTSHPRERDPAVKEEITPKIQMVKGHYRHD